MVSITLEQFEFFGIIIAVAELPPSVRNKLTDGIDSLKVTVLSSIKIMLSSGTGIPVGIKDDSSSTIISATWSSLSPEMVYNVLRDSSVPVVPEGGSRLLTTGCSTELHV